MKKLLILTTAILLLTSCSKEELKPSGSSTTLVPYKDQEIGELKNFKIRLILKDGVSTRWFSSSTIALKQYYLDEYNLSIGGHFYIYEKATNKKIGQFYIRKVNTTGTSISSKAGYFSISIQDSTNTLGLYAGKSGWQNYIRSNEGEYFTKVDSNTYSIKHYALEFDNQFIK